jgi:hypothetical protein
MIFLTVSIVLFVAIFFILRPKRLYIAPGPAEIVEEKETFLIGEIWDYKNSISKSMENDWNKRKPK